MVYHVDHRRGPGLVLRFETNYLSILFRLVYCEVRTKKDGPPSQRDRRLEQAVIRKSVVTMYGCVALSQ